MPMRREKTARAVEHGFVELCRSAFGTTLESVIVYGSFLRETFDPRSSDVNVLVIVTEGHESRLREFGRQGARLMRRYRITPLVLTHREFTTSADVFPMEYLDILQTHKALFGPDVTDGLTISRSNLRHEIEHQLRGSLIALRQLAVAAGRPRPFGKLLLRRRLEQWSGSVAAIMRALLRLHDVTEIPQRPAELVAEINRVLGLEPGPLLQLIEAHGSMSGGVGLIDSLLERLATLVQIVDSHTAEDGG